MWNKAFKKEMPEKFSGTVARLDDLIDLRARAAQQVLSHIKQWSPQTGQNYTCIRGRGIDFHTIREYQAGDDIRSMAWRVTARSMQPFVKVYQEEKERHIWLAVDLSPSLYFGTRCMFKSVKSIQQAALLGWSYLLKKERIGAIIAAKDNLCVYPPKIREQEYLTILNALAVSSQLKTTFNHPGYLRSLLLALQQKVRSGNLIFILSDFYQFDDEIQTLIAQLNLHKQVVLIFVYDPFEAAPPPSYQYFLTNDENKIAFNMDNENNRFQYQQQFKDKRDILIKFAEKNNIGLQILCTDERSKDRQDE